MKHKYIRHDELGFVLWPMSNDLYHSHIGRVVEREMPGPYPAKADDPAHNVKGYPAKTNLILSAGFADIEGGHVSCYGESESLGVKSRPDDSAALAKQLGMKS